MLEENSVYPVSSLVCGWHLCGYECPVTQFSLYCSLWFRWKPSLNPLLGMNLLLSPLSFVWEDVIYPLSSLTACVLGAIRYHLLMFTWTLRNLAELKYPSPETSVLCRWHALGLKDVQKEKVVGAPGTLSVSVASIGAHLRADEYWDTPCTEQLHSVLLVFLMARRTSTLSLYRCL